MVSAVSVVSVVSVVSMESVVSVVSMVTVVSVVPMVSHSASAVWCVPSIARALRRWPEGSLKFCSTLAHTEHARRVVRSDRCTSCRSLHTPKARRACAALSLER